MTDSLVGAPTPEPTPDAVTPAPPAPVINPPPAQAEVDAALVAELQSLKAQLAKAQAPSKAQVAALATKKGLKKLGATVFAIFTTPEAVKAEKSLLGIAIGRAIILVPAASGVIYEAVKHLGG